MNHSINNNKTPKKTPIFLLQNSVYRKNAWTLIDVQVYQIIKMKIYKSKPINEISSVEFIRTRFCLSFVFHMLVCVCCYRIENLHFVRTHIKHQPQRNSKPEAHN